MYEPKPVWKKIESTLNLLSVKTDKEISRVLAVYNTSLEEYQFGKLKEAY